MTAVLIPTASEAEWLDARRKGITASEIAIVMGLSPYSSPYALFHQKLGVLPGQEETDAMALGKYMEEFVADKFRERHPEWIVDGTGRGLYAHEDRPWQMATPDRVVWEYEVERETNGTILTDPVAVLECKIDGGSDEWGEDGSDEIPVHYRCQVLWQMDVMSVDTAFVACLLWNRRKVRVYEITLDDDARADLQLMRIEALAFLDRIRERREPDVDWRPATTDVLKTLYRDVDEDREVLIGRQLAISYRAAARRYREAEKRKDEMSARMLAAMRTARFAVDPLTHEYVATRSVSYPKRVSATLVRERYPDVAAECTPEPKPVIKLTPARAKKEKTS